MDASVRRFLAMVSHELRGPLTTIVMWERLLREHVDDPAVRVRALDAIRDSAATQARLVSDLLDVSRAVNGKLFLERELLHVQEVLAASLEAARPVAERHELTLAAEIQPRIGRVRADRVRLHQVFDNLLTNAIKFTPPGGSVSVVCRRARDSVAVDVRDTGRGISASLLRRLFVPFSQRGDAVTRRSGGLGLGLVIARELVTLHGGTLIAHSEGRGCGATFTVTLPLVRAGRAP